MLTRTGQIASLLLGMAVVFDSGVSSAFAYDHPIYEATNEALDQPLIHFAPSSVPGSAPAHETLASISITPGIIENIGKAIWPIIDAGRPVCDLKTDWANAIPEGILTWEALEGWQTPIAKSFSFKWKLLGVQMVSFDYTVVFTPGGSVNGKGHYLANATVIPSHLNVKWGYKFSSSAQIAHITNAGTSADPVAAMQLVLNWTIETPVSHHHLTSDFYMTGKGEFKRIQDRSMSGGATLDPESESHDAEGEFSDYWMWPENQP